MNVVIRVIGLVFLSTFIAIPQAAKIEDEKPAKTITICRIELTELGRTASFHFNYLYSVETDQNGSVEKIKKLRGPNQSEMVREDKMLECLKTWKLRPSTKYFVLFSIGTTSAPNYISISEIKGETIKLILP